MAIKVNGTTVINDSRALSNIASVDATTAASITAAGVGGSGGNIADWDPTSTPDVTFTSSGTWTNPNTADSTLVIFYAVGAGASGSTGYYAWGGGGGGAAVVAGTMGGLPSSVTITVGAGSAVASTNGGATTLAVSGAKTFNAPGGVYNGQSGYPVGEVNVPPTSNPFQSGYPVVADTAGGQATTRNDPVFGSVWGGGGGGGGASSSGNAGGTSTYAGDGGTGRNTSPYGGAGGFPGGGGGGAESGGPAGAGANGVVKIWYITA